MLHLFFFQRTSKIFPRLNLLIFCFFCFYIKRIYFDCNFNYTVSDSGSTNLKKKRQYMYIVQQQNLLHLEIICNNNSESECACCEHHCY